VTTTNVSYHVVIYDTDIP